MLKFALVGFFIIWFLLKLIAIILQHFCLKCLVNLTVEFFLIEIKFGSSIIDLFILDVYGAISLWLPES